MTDPKLIIDENTIVVCPWCKNITEYHQEDEQQCCQVCRRIFTEEDLRDEDRQED